jgi:hypothetical protein
MLWKNTVACELLEQLKLLQKHELFKEYILAGGTALALQTGYRTSEDIGYKKHGIGKKGFFSFLKK